MKNTKETEITALSEILRHLREENYKDYDDYASNLALLYVESLVNDDGELSFVGKASRIRTNFFKVNRIRKSDFLHSVYRRLFNRGIKTPSEITRPPLSIVDIFPDITNVRDYKSNIDKKLNIPESVIQNAFREALRTKKAFPMPRRGKDSALEVADIEHFHLRLNDTIYSFAVVVKGHNSVNGKVNWEDIAHQVTKAYEGTKPDYIIVATAVEPVDRLITEMRQYSESVGRPNLIIFVPPMDLAKFLRWQNII